DIADDITSVLDLNLKNRKDLTRDSIITHIAAQAEKTGICVLRNGKVGFNTHRKLNPDEFGGFALPDAIAPFVFVNTADFPAAQLFTLVHELTHIWLNIEGVSDAGLSHVSGRSEIEDLCDQVAVEVLVPEAIFRDHWGEHGQSLDQKAMYLQKIFKVSSVVIARRAFGLSLITADEFFAYYTYLKRMWDESKKKNKERKPDGGADFNNTFPATNSRNLTEAVLSSVGSGETLYREGSRLLGVKPGTLAIQAKQRGYA
ncbi:MAG: ImmA/IrrE family metallo-endopeptidase, partial [Spirochaetaceae bacterium]|nr:ImmA/IrrE family metallo-endopeptidase [Spirochaetaceae bacterium]